MADRKKTPKLDTVDKKPKLDSVDKKNTQVS